MIYFGIWHFPQLSLTHRTLMRIDIARDHARAQYPTRIRAQKKIRVASGGAKRSPTPTVPISPDRSLDHGFANNGVVARGPFFRWRLDTHRIYILLLLLGKRSSVERLFNTTRSFAHSPSRLFYDRGAPREQSEGEGTHPPRCDR